jgi:ABC-type nitrate/sulfonate/bicarbonate transport system permease component
MAEAREAMSTRPWVRRARAARLGRVDRAKLARWALSIGLFFVLWELIGRSGRIIAILPASEVLPDLARQIAEGEILAATLGTLRIAAVGFVIGAAIGVPVGLLLGLSERWSSVLDPLVNASLAAPIAMFIAVIAVYLGLEFKAKVVGVLLFNVFVIIVNTATGIREVPASVLEMGRAFGTSPANTYLRIILPWASPYIITGLRIGVGRSVEGAILFDLFLRTENLGLVIRNAAGSFDLSTLLGSVFFITIIAAGTMGLARIVEWRLLRWKTG